MTVNKVWKNDKSSSRPSSVKMQLYRDGKSYGSSVTLNSDNGWKYTWSNLTLPINGPSTSHLCHPATVKGVEQRQQLDSDKHREELELA